MPVTAADRAAYASAMEALVARAFELREEGAGEALALFVDLMADIEARIADMDPARWTAGFLREIQAELQDLVESWSVVYFEHAFDGLAEAFDLAAVGSVAPLAELGIITAEIAATMPAVDSILLNVASEFSADLIQNLEQDTKDAISGFVRRSILTGRTQLDTQRDIQRILEGVDADTFEFGSLARRAEVIYDTEVGRLFGMTDEVRSRHVEEMLPGTRKWWDASGDERTRPEHAALEAETKSAPILVAEPFVIVTKHGTVTLMYPVDPGAQGPDRAVKGQTIGCRCRRRTVLPVTRREPRPVTSLFGEVEQEVLAEQFARLEGRIAA